MSTAAEAAGLDVDADAAAAVARLWARAVPWDPITPEAMAHSLTGEGVTVRGDPERAVVATWTQGGSAALRLLVVDPDLAGGGLGSRLLTAAEDDARRMGATAMSVGADAPDHLFPGVDTACTPMLCLLEARGYTRSGANLNADVDRATLPEAPSDVADATGGDEEEIVAFTARHWPGWRDEAVRALRARRLLLTRDDGGVSGFCAYGLARPGWLGPVAVRPGLIGTGAGRKLVVGALHRMDGLGAARLEIAWVGPLRAYAGAVGARVGRVFIVHRRRL